MVDHGLYQSSSLLTKVDHGYSNLNMVDHGHVEFMMVDHGLPDLTMVVTNFIMAIQSVIKEGRCVM